MMLVAMLLKRRRRECLAMRHKVSRAIAGEAEGWSRGGLLDLSHRDPETRLSNVEGTPAPPKAEPCLWPAIRSGALPSIPTCASMQRLKPGPVPASRFLVRFVKLWLGML